MKIKCLLLVLVCMGSVTALSAQLLTFDQAKIKAEKENKSILMVFSGSDWCKPCMQFKKDVLENPEFHSYQNEKLVHLELDFPYRKKNRLSAERLAHNEQLAEKYNPKGEFPSIVLMDANGNNTSILKYKKGMHAEAFIDQLEKIAL